MNWKNAVVIATCVAFVAARAVDEAPILKQESKEILYRLNEPLRLDCEVGGPTRKMSNVIFTWMKDGKKVELDPNIIIPQFLPDHLLTLRSTKETEGEYQCLVTSELGTATSGFYNVKRTYLNVPKVEAQHLKPVEGEPLELSCPEVAAYPKPKILWMYQHGLDSSISHTILDPRITQAPNGNLYFSNVTAEDVDKNFKYVCTAKNPSVEEPVSIAEYVFDELKSGSGKESPRVPQYLSTDMTVKTGGVTAIYCIYGGTPLIPPSWLHNNVLILGGPNDRVTEHNRHKGKRLLIRDTNFKDQGNYTCSITENNGRVNFHSMKLTVVSAPKFTTPMEPKITASEGEDVILSCQISGGPVKTSWSYNAKTDDTLFKNERFSFDDTARNDDVEGIKAVYVVKIKNVQKSDTGYYACKGVSDFGFVYAETLLHVR